MSVLSDFVKSVTGSDDDKSVTINNPFTNQPLITIGGTAGEVLDWAEENWVYLTPLGLPLALAEGLQSLQLKPSPGLPPAAYQAESAGFSYSHIYANNYALPVVYGERMLGGHVTYLESLGVTGTDYDRNFLMVLSICEGEVESIEEVYLDSELIREGGTWKTYGEDSITYGGELDDDSERVDAVRKYTVYSDAYNGADAGATELAWPWSQFDWNQDNKLQGIAHVRLVLKWDPEGRAWSGVPASRFVVKGRKVYDPRTETTAYSSNPALCLLDYLRNSRYGCGIPDAEIDFDSFSDAADYCEQQITLYSVPGGASYGGDRFSCNVVLDTQSSLIDNVRRLLASCQGILYWSNGLYTLEIPKDSWPGADLTITEDMIIGGLSLNGEAKSKRYNKAVASFINPENDWQPDQVFWPEDDTYLEEDNNTPAEIQLSLDWETSPYRAKNLCSVAVLRSRSALSVSLTITSEGLDLRPNSLVALTYSGWGFASKKFLVTGIQLNPDGTVSLNLLEYISNLYGGYAGAQFFTPVDTNLPDTNKILSPQNLSVSETLYETTGSAGVKARAELSWDKVNDPYLDFYEYEFKSSSASTWRDGGSTRTEYGFLDDLAPGTWDFRVRAVNSANAKSPFVTKSGVTLQGLSAIPEDISGFSVVQINDQAHVFWDAPNDLDVRIGGRVRLRHYPATSGASWAGANDLANNLPPNNCAAVVPFIEGTYLAKFYDSTGNASENAASLVVEQSGYNATSTLTTRTEHSAFSGTLDDMVLDSGALKLSPGSGTFTGTVLGATISADTTITDLDTGSTDTVTLAANVDFSSALSTQYWTIGLEVGDSYTTPDAVVSTGSYTTGVEDLGSQQIVRVNSAINFSASQLLTDELINAWGALVDDITDWDTGSYGVDDVNAYTQMRTSNDNVTYSDWHRFRVGDYDKRYFQFRLIATTGSSNHQISVNELSFTFEQKV